MWSHKLASELTTLKKEWMKSKKAGRGHCAKTPRERFVSTAFLKWARENGASATLLNAYEIQYASFSKSNNRDISAFVQNLEKNKMCKVCSTLAPPRDNSVCGKCLQTTHGKEVAHAIALKRMKRRWAKDKNKLLRKQCATNKKRYGHDFPWQNPKIIQRKKARTKKLHGADHHFKFGDSLYKQQKAAYRIKSLKLGKRTFEYQGYEDTVIKRAVQKFGASNVLTQFDKGFVPIKSEDFCYYPDLFIKDNYYIEVKSRYTLLHSSFLHKNKAKASICSAMGIKVVWLVVEKGIIKKLPNKWFNLTDEKIKQCVASLFST